MNIPRQPNFNIAQDTNAIPASEFDNLSDEDLAKLIAESHKLKTGRSLSLPSTPPPQPKKVVDLTNLTPYFRSDV